MTTFLSGMKDSVNNMLATTKSVVPNFNSATPSATPSVTSSALPSAMPSSAPSAMTSASASADASGSSSWSLIIMLLLGIGLLGGLFLMFYPQYQNKDKLFALFGYGAAPTKKTSTTVKGASREDQKGAAIDADTDAGGAHGALDAHNEDEDEDEDAEGAASALRRKSASKVTPEVSSSYTKSKAGYCYIGDDQDLRTCIKVGANDKCMSGDIFPTQELCINPTLR